MADLRRVRFADGRTVLVGEHVADPWQPAGFGWCEVLITYGGTSLHHCYTYAKTQRDGRAVCNLRHREPVMFGPQSGVQFGGTIQGGDAPAVTP